MRAKHNLKIKLLLCVLAALLLCTALAACNKYVPNSFDYLVTFDYNLGTEISGDAPNMYLGLLDPDKSGSLVNIRPGFNTTTFKEAAIPGYYLEGWYLPKTILEDGTPEKDTSDGRVILGEKFDFATHRVTGDITLYANLIVSPKMIFVDADTGEAVSEIDGERPGNRRSKPSSSLAPKKTVDGQAYTFMGDYFKDPECTEEFTFPYQFTDQDVNVYCKFIKGSWALVKTASDLSSAIGNGNNVYLMSDIDMGGQSFGSASYNGEFNGNGYTVSRITINRTGDNIINSRTSNKNVGIFSTLLARAYVHDVTITDVVINIECASQWNAITGVNIGLLAGIADSGARVENVTLRGVISCNSYTYEAVKGGGRIELSQFIAQNNTSRDRIVNCDYSDVKVIYLS